MDPETEEGNDDFEVEDIVIDFEGNFDINSIEGRQVQIIGIDEQEPVLRIEDKFYLLTINNSIGSRLVFHIDDDRKLKYYAKTDKVVKARRVIIGPKEEKPQTDATKAKSHSK